MEQQSTPFECHLFVCTNQRNGERRSCGEHGGAALKAALKQAVANRGLKERVRVSESGCLGVCEQGPNVMIYPQELLFSAVSEESIEPILKVVEELLAEKDARG